VKNTLNVPEKIQNKFEILESFREKNQGENDNSKIPRKFRKIQIEIEIFRCRHVLISLPCLSIW
jgi:hypothetical protein